MTALLSMAVLLNRPLAMLTPIEQHIRMIARQSGPQDGEEELSRLRATDAQWLSEGEAESAYINGDSAYLRNLGFPPCESGPTFFKTIGEYLRARYPHEFLQQVEKFRAMPTRLKEVIADGHTRLFWDAIVELDRLALDLAAIEPTLVTEIMLALLTNPALALAKDQIDFLAYRLELPMTAGQLTQLIVHGIDADVRKEAIETLLEKVDSIEACNTVVQYFRDATIAFNDRKQLAEALTQSILRHTPTSLTIWRALLADKGLSLPLRMIATKAANTRFYPGAILLPTLQATLRDPNESPDIITAAQQAIRSITHHERDWR